MAKKINSPKARVDNNNQDKNELILSIEYQQPKLIWRIIITVLSLFLISILALIIFAYIKTNRLINDFTSSAAISRQEFFETSKSSLDSFQNNINHFAELPKKHNILILGTDQVKGREAEPELTDTILLLQIDAETERVKMLSLPRDLYDEAYQTKINALYQYGQERYPNEPERFPAEVVSAMTGVEIDYSMVLNINDLEQLIDILGGIEVDVPAAFTDSLFPRENVDIKNETDPAVLYKEISFSAGPQEMSGQTALEYMRSRHAEGDQGTDLARSQRQQLIITAMANKAKTTMDAKKLGQLYRFYLDNFAQYLSLTEIIEILTPLIVENNEFNLAELEFNSFQLTVYPENESGLIYQPPTRLTEGIWTYQIRDNTKFKEFFSEIFAKNNQTQSNSETTQEQ